MNRDIALIYLTVDWVFKSITEIDLTLPILPPWHPQANHPALPTPIEYMRQYLDYQADELELKGARLDFQIHEPCDTTEVNHEKHVCFETYTVFVQYFTPTKKEEEK